MSYVICDGCGDPAELADNADEARERAALFGFVRTKDGRDLCKRCKPLPAHTEDKGEGR